MGKVLIKGRIKIFEESSGLVLLDANNAIAGSFLNSVALCLVDPANSNLAVFSENFFTESNQPPALPGNGQAEKDGILYRNSSMDYRTIACELDNSFILANSAVKINGSFSPSASLDITGFELGVDFGSTSFNKPIANYDEGGGTIVTVASSETYKISWTISF